MHWALHYRSQQSFLVTRLVCELQFGRNSPGPNALLSKWADVFILLTVNLRTYNILNCLYAIHCTLKNSLKNLACHVW